MLLDNRVREMENKLNQLTLGHNNQHDKSDVSDPATESTDTQSPRTSADLPTKENLIQLQKVGVMFFWLLLLLFIITEESIVFIICALLTKPIV